MNNPRRKLLDEIEWIAQNGFDFIDLVMEAPEAALESIDWKAVDTAIKDHGLTVICQAASYLPISNPSPLVRQAALDELRRSIDAAHLINAPLLTMTFSGWPAYLSDKEGYEFIRQFCEILVQHGAERRVHLALQNSAQNQHQLKYFREIFHRLPQLKLTYNIGHGNVQTAALHTTRDYLFAFSDRLAHIQLSDNDGQHDNHLPPGVPPEGGIVLKRELQTLQSFRYDKSLTLQIFGERHWLLESAKQVQQIWDEIHISSGQTGV
ncbi:sugar phosphate isomerase/epimerase [Chloroflexi bacterium TSY]|nr:sugar phosphate isomerase/epimerase [Chloroflexi bacterium TSY]